MKKIIESYGSTLIVMCVVICSLVFILDRKYNQKALKEFKNQQTILFKQDSTANQLEIDYKKAKLERILR